MNSREKFLSVMNFDENFKVLKAEFGYWTETIRNWYRQGLQIEEQIPEDILDGKLIRGSKSLIDNGIKSINQNIISFFNLDPYPEKFPFDLSPIFEEKTLEENEDYKIFIDNFGIEQKVLKKNASIPMIIKYPIKNRKDFYNYIGNYDSNFDKRLPEGFDSLAKKLKNRDFLIRLGGNPFGFTFFARHLMGEVNFMMNLYDDPKLITELNDFILDFVMNYWSKILDKVEVDCVFILEDIAYRSGSFLSIDMFEEFITPYYRIFVDFLKQYKIGNIFIDCDGLINELIPVWINSGITGIFPIEGVNDIVEIRNKYPKLKLLGGFDKKVLFADSNKNKIDGEIDKVVKAMDKGGYIPHVDHSVSADVTFENFKYYRSKLNEIIDSKSK